MCWPLSSITGSPLGRIAGNARARPPRVRAASNTVSAWPARVALAAQARPAQPAPITATLFFTSCGPSPGSAKRTKRPTVEASQLAERLNAPRQPELAQRRQAHALVQDLEVVALDLAQQRAIDA